MWEAEALYNSPEEQVGCNPATLQPRSPAALQPRALEAPGLCVSRLPPFTAQAKRLAKRDADMERAKQAEATAAKARGASSTCFTPTLYLLYLLYLLATPTIPAHYTHSTCQGARGGVEETG